MKRKVDHIEQSTNWNCMKASATDVVSVLLIFTYSYTICLHRILDMKNKQKQQH